MGSHLWTQRHIEGAISHGARTPYMSIRLKSKRERVYATGDSLMP
jgi:hypothetical protein